jgi:uncharacterized protein YukE
MQLPDLVSLLIQIPLVGIFVWFTLRLSADYRADTEKRDAQWQTFISQQNELWRNFIRELVERSSSADDTVSQRLSELAGVIRSLVDDFKSHDQRSGRPK